MKRKNWEINLLKLRHGFFQFFPVASQTNVMNLFRHVSMTSPEKGKKALEVNAYGRRI